MAEVGVTVEQPDEWQAAHAALLELARRRAGLDFDEGRWLLRARRSQAHARLGYGSFTEYIERLFGYSPRLTHDKLRVAEALESLPEMAESLRQGGASWSNVRELIRVATPETEHAWLEQSRGRTAREVEKLVSGQRPGSLPGEPAEPGLERHVLRFEVSGEVLATFREALSKLRRDAGGHLDDDDALLLMARQVLGGPIEEGRGSYQVQLTVCDRCERALQLANGELVEISRQGAEMAKCDAQELANVHAHAHVGQSVGDKAQRATQDGKAQRATQDGKAQRATQDGKAQRATQDGKAQRATQDGKAQRATQDGKAQRATQDVPPAVRRAVLRRDRHRCQVPGCRHADFIDLHHVQPREEGSSHAPENLITLCAAHHRACHGGALAVTGNPSAGLTFRHADGTSYGGEVSAPCASLRTRAFQALRGLGFKEKAARDALRCATAQAGDGADLPRLLRHALQLLTEHAWQRSA